MLKAICSCLLVALVMASLVFEGADSHSFPMSAQRRAEANRLNKGRALPVVWSYHIHCVFINGDPDSVAAALTLRENFIDHFNLSQVERCQSLFDDIRLCMFEVEMVPDLNSPFISGNWAAMVPVEWFDKIVQWSLQNRGLADIFIHPNSGAEVSDHLVWSLSGGNKWQINKAAFSNQTLF